MPFGPDRLIVTSNISKTNDTEFSNINQLRTKLVPGKAYFIELNLYTQESNTGGLKMDFAGGDLIPIALIGQGLVISNNNPPDKIPRFNALDDVTVITGSTGVFLNYKICLTVDEGTRFIPRFAQQVSDGTATTIIRGSHMLVRQLN